MPNTPSQETLDNSLLRERGIADITRKETPFFVANVAVDGPDFVYNFWPPGQANRFHSVFGLALERGFKKILPSSADVRAGHTDLREAAAMVKAGEGYQGDVVGMKPEGPLVPRESFWVRVVGWADRPMADVFLKERVFKEILSAAEEICT